jgi:hypothetical protein
MILSMVGWDWNFGGGRISDDRYSKVEVDHGECYWMVFLAFLQGRDASRYASPGNAIERLRRAVSGPMELAIRVEGLGPRRRAINLLAPF